VIKSPAEHQNVKFSHIVGGGQTIGKLPNGKKVFAWGVLPGETADIVQHKKKSNYIEAIATNIVAASGERVEPKDPTSYLSTSPWQIMTMKAENHYKAALIEEAFELHDIVLPEAITIKSSGDDYFYRNKIEYSWWWNNDSQTLDLAFFRRGTKGKIPIETTSLASPSITQASLRIRDLFRAKNIIAYDLKTLLVRSNSSGQVAAQVYVKTPDFITISTEEFKSLEIQSLEVIYSNPKSPASVITEKLQSFGQPNLEDSLQGISFNYATEGFFQINLPVYEQVLTDMKDWIPTDKRTVDLYSGVGTIGLTIGGNDVTLIEVNEPAVREMQRNIDNQPTKKLKAVLAASEDALDYIKSDATIIIDPPRAGLHSQVVNRLLEAAPERIVYLSCNPVTQARDVALLAEKYGIRHHQGYNFFPHTPHIEHLVILDKINN
jgi:23S rRNA (uracil1939-C5)-methyltransferase